MLAIFLAVLALLGGALIFRGRETRGLMVVALVAATEAGCFVVEDRWGWLALALAGLGACGVAMALATRGGA